MKLTQTLFAIFMRPVVLDAILYACIGMFTFMQGYLSTEEAYKYCSPFILFWLKFSIGSMGACVGALKMFRSTTFADHQKTIPPVPPTVNTTQTNP